MEITPAPATPSAATVRGAGHIIVIAPRQGEGLRQPGWTTPRDEFGQPELEASRANIDRVLGRTQDFFAQHGIDERRGNGPVDVYHDLLEPNAAYIQSRRGEEALVFGFDRETGVSYGMADDVVAHEFAHRVVEKHVQLEHHGPGGTVGEHFADVFAAVIDDDDPWTIGEEIRPGGIRSMKHPEDPRYAQYDLRGRLRTQPGHASDFRDTINDDGGVHINVGILNKAAAQIGDTIGRDKLGAIYAHSLKHTLPDGARFGEAVSAVKDATADLYGVGSTEYEAVQRAWESVAR